MGTVPCPSCGVAVAIGYPRCPKCHGVVPAPRSKRPTFREEALAGGTTTEPERDGASGVWIIVALAVIATAGVIAYMATRGGGKPAPDTSGSTGDDDDTSANTPPTTDDQGPAGGSAAAAAPAPVDDGEAARRALGSLDDELRGDRMWATVTRDHLEVVVASSLCGEAGMKPSIAKATAPLLAAGFTSLRCEEKNGHVVFEEPLQ